MGGRGTLAKALTHARHHGLAGAGDVGTTDGFSLPEGRINFSGRDFAMIHGDTSFSGFQIVGEKHKLFP